LFVHGQGCDGNLGDNIFTEGEFGSGTANVLQEDPNIAPGYTYVTTPPPPDGSYIITNGLDQWASRYDWPPIASDNSTDPNGYMMVVNASFEPGLFYEQVVDGLCENTNYVFSADVFNIHPAGRNLIRPNVSFLLDDQVVFETGEVPENGEWNNYAFTFTTGLGVTSIKLSLSNNAPGGNGNDLILDNIRFQACGPKAQILPTAVENICEDGSPIELSATIEGDQYDQNFVQWQQSFDGGTTWEDIEGETNSVFTHTNLSSGMYYYRYLLAGASVNLQNEKCRVNSNVKIVNVIPKEYMVYDTLCNGLTYSLGDQEVGTTGVYTDSLVNYIGCDSIVTLDLTIVEDLGIEADFELKDPSCADLQDGSISINEIRNGTAPIDIYVDGQLSLNMGALDAISTEPHFYQFVDRYGCDGDTIVSLGNPTPFDIDLGLDTLIALGQSITINIDASHPINSYDWSPDGAVNCSMNCNSLEFLPLESLALSLTATSEDGCVASDVIFITVDKVRKVYFPNAISPNDDGINDRFTIYGDQPNVAEIVSFQIYDRWSNLIFEQNNFQSGDSDLGWDGKYKGNVVDSGVYVYVASIRFIDNELVKYSGDISVFR